MDINIIAILILSMAIILWRVCIYGLYRGVKYHITKDRAGLRIAMYFLMLVLIFFTLYDYPDIFQRF
uniref:Uncharacterized protein n=1 Tax=viral metagenome TaxID=1070528 RepID=A0A6C0DE16_9ZZZZ